jgi:hypothetical protein
MRARFLGKDPGSHIDPVAYPVRDRPNGPQDLHRPGLEGDRPASTRGRWTGSRP